MNGKEDHLPRLFIFEDTHHEGQRFGTVETMESRTSG